MKKWDKGQYQELLEQVLATAPYDTWTQVNNRDDWRDSSYLLNHNNISPVSLSTTGLTDFSSEPASHLSLIELAKNIGVLQSYSKNKELVPGKSLKTTTSEKPTSKNLPAFIYHNSRCSQDEIKIIKKYFQKREVCISDETIDKAGIRYNLYNDVHSIVIPYKNTKDKIVIIEKIHMDEHLISTGRTKHGVSREDRALVINGHIESGVILESFTDAVAYIEEFDSKIRIVVSGGTSGFSKIESFIKDGDVLILDPDKKNQSFIHSLVIKKNIIRKIPLLGEGIDCAKSVEMKVKNLWKESLTEIKDLEKPMKVGNFKPKTWRNELIMEYMNHRHALIRVSGRTSILNEEYNPTTRRRGISFSSESDFKLYYGDEVSGKETIAETWLKSPLKKKYTGIIFDPKSNPEGYYNLWKGFACKSVKGTCDRYLEHLKNVICNGNDEYYDYILDWMSDAIQNPTKKPGVAIVLRGGSGTGKGTFATIFGSLFGNHFLPLTEAKHITGTFNSHLMNCILLFADEAMFGGDEKAEAALKTLITESTKEIEFKYQNAFIVPNYIHLIIASNKQYVVRLEGDDRRYFVLDVNKIAQKKHAYFDAIYKEADKGGRQALMYFLLNRKIRKNLKNIPETEASKELKEFSLSLEASFWKSKLEDGWTERLFISSKDLYLEYVVYFKDTETKLMNKNMFSRVMTKITNQPKGVFWVEEKSQRGAFYIFKDCTSYFEKEFGIRIDHSI
jgi:hypothetical protein